MAVSRGIKPSHYHGFRSFRDIFTLVLVALTASAATALVETVAVGTSVDGPIVHNGVQAAQWVGLKNPADFLGLRIPPERAMCARSDLLRRTMTTESFEMAASRFDGRISFANVLLGGSR